MKKRVYMMVLLLLIIIVPTIGWAHPGHGMVPGTPMHYIFSWEHAWSIITLLAISAVIYFLMRYLVDGKKLYK